VSSRRSIAVPTGGHKVLPYAAIVWPGDKLPVSPVSCAQRVDGDEYLWGLIDKRATAGESVAIIPE
jgi:hypothetical protein